MGSTDPRPGPWKDRARELAMIVPAVGAFALLRWAGLVSATPVWVYTAALVGAYAASSVVAGRVPADGSQRGVWTVTGVTVLAATVPMYLTGWGPMLAVGYLALMADALRTSGSRAMRPVLTWSLVGLIGGQLLIWAGVFPTMVREPLVHGAAVLAGLAVIPAAAMIATTTARRERSEETATLLLGLARALADAETRAEVGQRVAEAVPALVGLDRAIVMLWEPDDKVLVTAGFHGYPAELAPLLQSLRIDAADATLVEEVSGHPVLRNLPSEDVGDPHLRELLDQFGTVESFVAPITWRSEVLGFLTAERSNGHPAGMSSPLLARLSGLADQAAIAVSVARLLEQEREISDQLRQADRHKSEFLAVVSHELRTPLSVMMGAAGTLQWRHGELDDATRAELIESVVRRGQQLNRLVDDLLQASGDVQLELAAVDVASLVRMAVSDAAALYPEATFRCDVDGRAIPVRADAFRLRQVVDNLIGNAAKYAPSGRIAVDAGERHGWAWFTVTDDGPGMTPEQVARVFEPFYQVDSSAVRRMGGLGLGLHICRRIVEAHRGEIGIESTPGAGTCVRVELPAGGPR